MDVASKQRPDLLGYDNVVRKINEKTTPTVDREKALFIAWKKYTTRYRKGDIVEARRDNGPRGKLEEASFIFLQVPSITLKDAKQYEVSLEDLTDFNNRILLKRRKYYVDMMGLTLDVHKNVSLTENEFNTRLKVKK